MSISACRSLGWALVALSASRAATAVCGSCEASCRLPEPAYAYRHVARCRLADCEAACAPAALHALSIAQPCVLEASCCPIWTPEARRRPAAAVRTPAMARRCLRTAGTGRAAAAAGGAEGVARRRDAAAAGPRALCGAAAQRRQPGRPAVGARARAGLQRAWWRRPRAARSHAARGRVHAAAHAGRQGAGVRTRLLVPQRLPPPRSSRRLCKAVWHLPGVAPSSSLVPACCVQCSTART
jgi:hypothetical protein